MCHSQANPYLAEEFALKVVLLLNNTFSVNELLGYNDLWVS